MATKTIGRLAVDLVANTSKFSKGIRKAGTDIRQLGLQMTAVGVAMVAPFALAIKSFSSYGDAIAKMAKRTGLSTETVSYLGYVAELSGTSVETLEKGVRRMAQTISYAKDGLMTYTRALDKVGLKAEDLEKLSPEEAFIRTGKAISKIENPLTRAAAAQEIFGRAGSQLLPLFAEGEAAMRRMARHASMMGLILGSKVAKQAEALNDAMGMLKSGMAGVAIEVVQSLGIPFDNLMETVAKTIEQVRLFIRSNRDLIKHILETGAAILATGLTLVALGTALKLVFSPTAIVGIAIIGIVALLDALRLTNTGFMDFVENVRLGGIKIGTWFAALGISATTIWLDAMNDIRQSWDAIIDWIAVGIIRLQGLFETLGAAIRAIMGTATLDDLLGDPRKARQRETAIGLIAKEGLERRKQMQEKYVKEIAQLEAKMDKLFLKDLSEYKPGKWGDEIKGLLDNWTDALEDSPTIQVLKEIVAPGAFERGTREAYGAEVQPLYKAMNQTAEAIARNTARSNALLEENNTYQRDALANADQLVGI